MCLISLNSSIHPRKKGIESQRKVTVPMGVTYFDWFINFFKYFFPLILNELCYIILTIQPKFEDWLQWCVKDFLYYVIEHVCLHYSYHIPVDWKTELRNGLSQTLHNSNGTFEGFLLIWKSDVDIWCLSGHLL